MNEDARITITDAETEETKKESSFTSIKAYNRELDNLIVINHELAISILLALANEKIPELPEFMDRSTLIENFRTNCSLEYNTNMILTKIIEILGLEVSPFSTDKQ